MTVIDASAAINMLSPRGPEDRVRADLLLHELRASPGPWLAPDIVVFEVFSVMRRRTLRREITPESAARVLERLGRIPIELFRTATLIRRAWLLRDRFSAGDALYAALALAAQVPLLTADAKLANGAEAAGIVVRRA